MKKILILIVFLSLLACNKDQVLLRDVAKNWEIDKLTFVNTNPSLPDSVVQVQGNFNIERCKLNDTNGTGCGGYYEWQGISRVNAQFLPDESRNTIFINILETQDLPVDLRGNWNIESLSKDAMILSGVPFTPSNYQLVISLVAE